MSKIQGEGDRESARLYNKHTREDVEKSKPEDTAAAARDPGDAAEGAQARAAGKSHAKRGEQDKRDAEVLRALETRKESRKT